MIVKSFEVTRGGSRLSGTGAFTHPRADWRNGTASASVQLSGLELTDIPAVQNLRKGTAGSLTANVQLEARVANGEPRLTSLAGETRLANVVIDGRQYGGVAVVASTATNGK